MNRIYLGVACIYGLLATGCANELSKIQTVYSVVTQATVSPTEIDVAGNSFDALEGLATQYLNYCRGNLGTTICSSDNRRTTIRAVRAGRSARNQLEPYVASGTAGPSVIYNTLVTAINTLKASPKVPQ